jgi:hypothetical protein
MTAENDNRGAKYPDQFTPWRDGVCALDDKYIAQTFQSKSLSQMKLLSVIHLIRIDLARVDQLLRENISSAKDSKGDNHE